MLLQPSLNTLFRLLLSTMVAGACLISPSQAALNITPPQLAPDQNGIIATEVKSSLTMPSRWSVRVVAWDPTTKEPTNNSPTPAAQPVSTTPSLPSLSAAATGSALATAATPLGVDISPRFFSLPPSGRQVIRARVTDRSRYYRLLIEQIPDDSPTSQGVNFRFRFSLPIFRSSQDPLIPRGIVIQ
jgi:P pilus assembly chaperone PapD